MIYTIYLLYNILRCKLCMYQNQYKTRNCLDMNYIINLCYLNIYLQHKFCKQKLKRILYNLLQCQYKTGMNLSFLNNIHPSTLCMYLNLNIRHNFLYQIHIICMYFKYLDIDLLHKLYKSRHHYKLCNQMGMHGKHYLTNNIQNHKFYMCFNQYNSNNFQGSLHTLHLLKNNLIQCHMLDMQFKYHKLSILLCTQHKLYLLINNFLCKHNIFYFQLQNNQYKLRHKMHISHLLNNSQKNRMWFNLLEYK